jgi:hypothetical protein
MIIVDNESKLSEDENANANNLNSNRHLNE